MQQGGAQSAGTPAELPVSCSVYCWLSALPGLCAPGAHSTAQHSRVLRTLAQETREGPRGAEPGVLQSECGARQRPCNVMEALARPGEGEPTGRISGWLSLEMAQSGIYSLVMSSWYRMFYVGSLNVGTLIWCHYRTIKCVIFWL